MADYDDIPDDDDELAAPRKGLTFDDMVSFTMFAEMTIVLFTCATFLIILYYTF